jgi:hypothetical protein
LNIISIPPFFPSSTGSWTVVSYNVTVSRASGNAPNYFGPWTTLFTATTSNTDLIDPSGEYWDLYRVTPNIQIGSTIYPYDTMQSRAFFASQPLYDTQISSLLVNFRTNFIIDPGIPQSESTVVTETTGGNLLPFMTDATTTRFYFSFMSNDDPIKVISESVVVYAGASESVAVPLTPYTDYYVSETGGYIQFATAPAANSYMKVDFTKVKYTNDEVRNSLLNAVSDLSNYGINGFQVYQSNNLSYLATPLPSLDLGQIVSNMAAVTLLNGIIHRSVDVSESWKDGASGVEYTLDPSRTIQAAAQQAADLHDKLKYQTKNYIINNRNYTTRGEFESFFDVSGVLPVFSLIVAGANLGGAYGFWL